MYTLGEGNRHEHKMSQEVIRLQGKAYDAVTGALATGVVKTSKKPATRHTVIAKISTTSVHHSTINHMKAHAAQPSHTLMRRAVKKPGQSLKRQVHVQGALTRPLPATVAVKHSVAQVDAERLHKAQQIPKHQRVNRFGTPTEEVAFKFADIPVHQAPDTIPSNNPPVTPPPTPTNRPTDVFEQAMHTATNFIDITAHRAHFKKVTRRHMLSAASGTLALLLIAGFAAYQNTPGLQLKVAGFRAGVATATPDFRATGFAYNGATADHSRLVIGLKSASGDYQLSEQKTNWSSQDMISQVSAVDASGQANYSTMQAAGNTVYRLGSTQATWVKDGIWYQVNGNQNLTDKQLAALVQNT